MELYFPILLGILIVTILHIVGKTIKFSTLVSTTLQPNLQNFTYHHITFSKMVLVYNFDNNFKIVFKNIIELHLVGIKNISVLTLF